MNISSLHWCRRRQIQKSSATDMPCKKFPLNPYIFALILLKKWHDAKKALVKVRENTRTTFTPIQLADLANYFLQVSLGELNRPIFVMVHYTWKYALCSKKWTKPNYDNRKKSLPKVTYKFSLIPPKNKIPKSPMLASCILMLWAKNDYFGQFPLQTYHHLLTQPARKEVKHVSLNSQICS